MTEATGSCHLERGSPTTESKGPHRVGTVFETRKGDIITEANEIINLDAYSTYGALSGAALIIGGSGDFEGTTGWVGWVITEGGGGALRGEICTP